VRIKLPFVVEAYGKATRSRRAARRLYGDEIEICLREANNLEAPLAMSWLGTSVNRTTVVVEPTPVRIYGGDGCPYEPLGFVPVRRFGVHRIRATDPDVGEKIVESVGHELARRASLRHETQKPSKFPKKPSETLRARRAEAVGKAVTSAAADLLVIEGDIWVRSVIPMLSIAPNGPDSLDKATVSVQSRGLNKGWTLAFLPTEMHLACEAAKALAMVCGAKNNVEVVVTDEAASIEVIDPTLISMDFAQGYMNELSAHILDAMEKHIPYGDESMAVAYDVLRKNERARWRSTAKPCDFEADARLAELCFEAYQRCGGPRVAELRGEVARVRLVLSLPDVHPELPGVLI